MTGSELLLEAEALVALGWCQHAEARTLHGTPIDVLSSRAAEWSLLGALQAATFRDPSTSLDDLRSALEAIADLIEDPSLADWNDAAERTADEVTELLADAGKLASLDAPSAV
jgi:hypothetical protein